MVTILDKDGRLSPLPPPLTTSLTEVSGVTIAGGVTRVTSYPAPWRVSLFRVIIMRVT